MLQLRKKNQAMGSAPHLPIDEIEQSSHQDIGYGHQVHYPVVDAFGGFSIGLTLHHCTAHGTLGVHCAGEHQKKQQ